MTQAQLVELVTPPEEQPPDPGGVTQWRAGHEPQPGVGRYRHRLHGQILGLADRKS